MKKKIKLANLVKDAGTQFREALDSAHLDTLVGVYEDGEDLPPPVDVFQTFAGGFILADGFHRCEAAEKAGLKDIEAEVHKGEFIDALKFALGANSRHGLRLTTKEKQAALKIAVEKFPDMVATPIKIARLCGISRSMVNKFLNPTPPMPKKPEPVAESEECNLHAPEPEPESKSTPKMPPAPAKPAQKPSGQRKDRFGRVIPPAVVPTWDRAEEAFIALSPVNVAKGILQKAQDEQDLAFAGISFSTAKGSLEQAWADIKSVKPYAVCTSCSGNDPKKCSACKGRGFVSEFYWKQCVPEETRKMIEKGAKK